MDMIFVIFVYFVSVSALEMACSMQVGMMLMCSLYQYSFGEEFWYGLQEDMLTVKISRITVTHLLNSAMSWRHLCL